MVPTYNDSDSNRNSFSKTICPICFEDLKPLVEDFQSISVCGHVFHELCLQQWFECCPNRKKSCPICKQACTNANVKRLYFQSVGGPNDCSSQKPSDHEESPEELRNEVNRLEGKVAALTSCLEQRQKDFVEVKDELVLCTDQLKAEVALKHEALIQASTSQQLLRLKSEELDKSKLECMRAREKSMALVQELATYRLAYDMDLKEDEAMKLASLGNDTGSREGNHLLIKSLATHKRSYKELLAKCNDLGRREARHSEELDNANKKIKKLKLRVRELASAVEMKENEALRVLKDQNTKLKSSHEHQMKKPANQACLDEINNLPDMSCDYWTEELPKPMSLKKPANQAELPKSMKKPANQACLDEISNIRDASFDSWKEEPPTPMSWKSTTNDRSPRFTRDQNEQPRGPSLMNQDKDASFKKSVPSVDDNVTTVEEHQNPRPLSCFNGKNVVKVNSDNEDGESCSWSVRRGIKRDRTNEVPSNEADEVICFGNTNPVKTSPHTEKETGSSVPLPQPGAHCFSGGLLGPDGTNWHLGKWCKKAKNQGSNASSGDLITIGADGRGGKIKVLRSLHQSSLDICDTTSWTRKCKQTAKPKKVQGKGALNIEHFFRKTGER